MYAVSLLKTGAESGTRLKNYHLLGFITKQDDLFCDL